MTGQKRLTAESGNHTEQNTPVLSDRQTANNLAYAGYRRTSRKHGMVARVDRADWREEMAKRHSPWSKEEGTAWVDGLGNSAADFYRRVYSSDKFEVAAHIALMVPASDHDVTAFIPEF